INLHRKPSIYSIAKTSPLINVEALRSLLSGILFAPIVNPGIDLFRCFRKRRINGHCDAPHAGLHQVFKPLRQAESISGSAEDQVWKFPVDQSEGLKSRFVSQRITRTGDSNNT